MSERFRIPKSSIQAEVHLEGGERRAAFFFLGDRAQGHDGPEQISDLLSSDMTFIPIRDARTQEVNLVRRASIVAVAVPSGPAAGELAGMSDDPEVPVSTAILIEVSTADGASFRGTLRYFMPEGRQRVQDYLNLPDPLVVLDEGERVLLLSKHHINTITLISSS